MCIIRCHQNLPICTRNHLFLSSTPPPTNSSPCWTAALPFPLPPDWQCGGLATLLSWGRHWTPGYCSLIINYWALLPHLEQAQAGNELSPLGRTSGWAVYGGGWALPSGGVNGPSRGTHWSVRVSDNMLLGFYGVIICHYIYRFYIFYVPSQLWHEFQEIIQRLLKQTALKGLQYIMLRTCRSVRDTLLKGHSSDLHIKWNVIVMRGSTASPVQIIVLFS